MTNKTQEFRQEKTETLKRMKNILDTVDSEKRVMNKAEEEDYKQMDARIDELNKLIEKHEGIILKRANIEAELAEGRQVAEKIHHHGDTGAQAAKTGPATRARDIKGYKPREDELSETDFWRCLATKDYGPLASYRAENRGTQIGVGAAGGFALPSIVQISILDSLLADQGIFSRIGKEFVDGADSLTVATFENCNIDANGLYGFSLPTYIHEGGTITAGENKLQKKEWTLRKLPIETKISLEAMATGVFGNTIQQAITNVLKYGLEKYIISGSGVAGESQGIIKAPCTLEHSRAGAGAIDFIDAYNMLAKTRLGNGNVWIASQTVIPELASMVDAGNHAVWLGNNAFDGAAGKIPSTLLGYPILFTLGINPALGSKGDIVFASDMSFYKAVIFQDIFVQMSEAAYWSTGEVGIRVIMMLDMAALPTDVITIGGSQYGWATVLSA